MAAISYGQGLDLLLTTDKQQNEESLHYNRVKAFWREALVEFAYNDAFFVAPGRISSVFVSGSQLFLITYHLWVAYCHHLPTCYRKTYVPNIIRFELWKIRIDTNAT